MTGVITAALLLCGASPAPGSAQLGAIIDQIQKMSGPTMLYFGPIFRWGYQPGQRLEPEVDSVAVDSVVDAARISGELRRELLDCAQQARAILDSVNEDDFYDELSVDRYRANERRIQRLQEGIGVTTTDERQVAALANELREIVCEQPRLLSLAMRDRDPRGGLVWRIGAAYGWDIGNDRPAGVGVLSLKGELSAEYRYAFPMRQWINLGVEVGITGHYFHGGFDSFIHPTGFVKVNVHPFSRCRGWLLRNARVGTGLYRVPPFDSGDFNDIYQMEDKWEWIWLRGFVAVDISSGSFSGNNPIAC